MPTGNDIIDVLTTASQCSDYDVMIFLDPIKEQPKSVMLQFESGSQSEKLFYFCIPFSKPQVL